MRSLRPARGGRPAFAAAAVVTAGVLAGCSSGTGSTASGSPSGAATTASAGASGAALSSTDLATLLAYTHGTAGPATGTPIKLGLINSEGGTNSFPEYTSGYTAAVALLNSQLGGIGGHPVTLVPCYVADSDEQGQACAQKFLADDGIVAVLQGAVEAGDSSYHSTLAGKIPVLGVNPTDISDATATNAYYIEGGQFAAPAIISYVGDVLKASSVALLSAQGLPPAVQVGEILAAGLKAKNVSVKQAQYSQTGTDYLAPVQASGASTASAVVPLVIAPQQCIAMANAVKTLAITAPVVTLSACLGPAVTSALGDYPKWTYLDFTVNPDATDPDPAVQADVAAYKAFEKTITGTNVRPGVSVQTLQGLLTLAKAMGTTAPTRESIASSLKAFTGPVFLGSPTIAFGANPAMPSIGATSVRFYDYTGNGTWADKTAGKWISAPMLTGHP